MANFCSKCGKQLSESERFCSNCGASLGGEAQSGSVVYMQNAIPANEMPSEAHEKAFTKCMGMACTVIPVGLVMGGIAAISTLSIAWNAGGFFDTINTVLMIAAAVCALASLVLLGLAVGVRMKPQRTRTQLRYGMRFVHLSLSALDMVAVLAGAYSFFLHKNFNIHQEYTYIIAIGTFVMLAVVEIIIKSSMDKFKSDASYRFDSGNAVRGVTASGWKCGHCGTENSASAEKCSFCGKVR